MKLILGGLLYAAIVFAVPWLLVLALEVPR